MASPALKSTMSPTTTSRMGICTTVPPRRTRQRIPPASCSSRSKARAEPYSERVEISVARKTATPMPMVSPRSPLPNKRSKWIARAAKRMRITGSLRLPRNCRKKLLRFCRDRIFSPCSRRARKTSSPRNPKDNVVFSSVPFIFASQIVFFNI